MQQNKSFAGLVFFVIPGLIPPAVMNGVNGVNGTKNGDLLKRRV